MTINKLTEVIIIGAGPAGIACAIQLKRHNIGSIVIEEEAVGGLLKNASLIENYLGFPVGISGDKLIELMKTHVASNDLNIKNEIVESVKYSENKFAVRTNENLYHSEYLVIASGTKPINLKKPIMKKSISDKVFYDIYKLGKIKNKKIAIIGAGDCAFDYALSLQKYNKVTILNRSDKIKALPILQNRATKSKNIKYFENATVISIDENAGNPSLKIRTNLNTIYSDYLLIAIGREPNLDFIDKGLFNNSNVYQIGDVKNRHYRQVSIATGDGTLTAMNINTIKNLEVK